MQYDAVQYSAVRCSAVQYDAVQYSTVRCNVVQYNVVQCSTRQCNVVPGETLETDCVRAGQQLRRLLGAVEGAEAGAAREEGLVEVLVVDGDGLHQGGGQVHPASL